MHLLSLLILGGSLGSPRIIFGWQPDTKQESFWGQPGATEDNFWGSQALNRNQFWDDLRSPKIIFGATWH